jgi:hypothetical protein
MTLHIFFRVAYQELYCEGSCGGIPVASKARFSEQSTYNSVTSKASTKLFVNVK